MSLVDPAKVKDELLKAYPAKVARQTSTADHREQSVRRRCGRADPGERAHDSRNHYATRLLLRRVQGSRVGADSRYCQYHARADRLRFLFMADAPQSNTYHLGCRRTVHDLLLFDRHAGRRDHLRRREETGCAVQEAYDLFHPKAIGIFATCPVGLIGDDVHHVASQMKEKLGINVFAFSCEGYKGVSQSAGHHIANNQLFKHVIGLDDTPHDGKFRINLLGEYNIGGDAFLIEKLLDKCGITLVSTFSGNSTIDGFQRAHTADLNCVMCHRSINYVADMIEQKFGVPWIKVNFLGATATAKSLRKIAAYFEDPQLAERVDAVIEEEMGRVREVQDTVRPRCEGKRAMLFVGGSRAHHYQELFAEIGMPTVAAGYEFAHRDDYEGRHVLPGIKVDADSRNIEELKVTPDPTRYQPRISDESLERLEQAGVAFKDYRGMMPEMSLGSLVIDDISQHETEVLLAPISLRFSARVSKRSMPCRRTAFRACSCTATTTAGRSPRLAVRASSIRRSTAW